MWWYWFLIGIALDSILRLQRSLCGTLGSEGLRPLTFERIPFLCCSPSNSAGCAQPLPKWHCCEKNKSFVTEENLNHAQHSIALFFTFYIFTPYIFNSLWILYFLFFMFFFISVLIVFLLYVFKFFFMFLIFCTFNFLLYIILPCFFIILSCYNSLILQFCLPIKEASYITQFAFLPPVWIRRFVTGDTQNYVLYTCISGYFIIFPVESWSFLENCQAQTGICFLLSRATNECLCM